MKALNIFDGPLEACGTDPLTGFMRDGHCRLGPGDTGVHTVCAVVTEEFLTFSQRRGNDLSTPRPEYHFPGLKPGDRWCLCAMRWKEAFDAGCAPPVVLEATHLSTLEFIDREDLAAHAFQED
ncbi:MAG: DUF2237 domain-containing protein [Akkermansiaceae bacterium]|nr:DUF2237 domain-containing protein [Akkermansiaceae bacterium]NNM30823.1 DUF2237 domain-containing protein [Akkermansiaceae bacterium]